MNEREIISEIAACFPRSGSQVNTLFECDAEIVSLCGQLWGLTMDDFSPEEDLFSRDDPARLGANLAVATLSDLLAAGVQPKYYLHALSIPRDVNADFLRALTGGIQSVLEPAECSLCGGDLGAANPWRYCGFAMGPVVSPRPLTHRLPAEPQTLWVTGALGDANLAAFRNQPAPRFELRLGEARAIWKHAVACIDTSGGLMAALWLLHELNPELRFELHAERIPLAEGLRALAQAAGIPAEAALMGGAGEYELLFSAGASLADTVKEELFGLGMTPIADVYLDRAPGIYIFRHGEQRGMMTEAPPCPRSAAGIPAHMEAVIRAAAILFGRDGCT